MQRRNRLGSQSLIRRVYATGARQRTRGATVTGILKGTDAPLIAVVASRRVGGSVVRNRARRRMRAAVDALLPGLRPGVVAVVAATAETTSMPFQKLADSIARGFEKAGLTRIAGA